MGNIMDKGYATFMEETLRDMVALPVEGICIVAKLKGGSHMVSYFNTTPTDKVTYAGLIQQDAMIDVLQKNGMLRNDNTDPE